MPTWAYNMAPLQLALIMVASIEAVSLFGLFLARRFLLPHLHFHDGVNDAISGTVQAIGVFYGITVGLIAVGVWNTHSNAADIVSKKPQPSVQCIGMSAVTLTGARTVAKRSEGLHRGAYPADLAGATKGRVVNVGSSGWTT